MAKAQPIAIVGVGALLPGSAGAEGFWRDIVSGRDLITDVPPRRWLKEDHYDPNPQAPDKTYCHRGSFLSPVDFDPLEFGVPPTAIPATDTCQLLALQVAKWVLDDVARSQKNEIDRERAGVILGVTSGQELFLEVTARLRRPVWVKALREHGITEDKVESICEQMASSSVPWQENTFPGMLGNVVAGRVANRFDLHGTNCVTDAACASSLAAISMAMDELRLGRADLMLAGGADTFNDISMYVAFSKTPALSATGDCRPFSDRADGTVLGEGFAMFALKRLEDAERDGNHIYAVIRGIGSSSDGKAKSIYAPLPTGQARAMHRAYDDAGFGPETVGLVEAHGTGTAAGDQAELESLKSVFTPVAGEKRQWCALGSVKSQVGHTKAAAGAVGIFKAALALHHKILPPTLKVERPNPALHLEESPFYLNAKSRPWVQPEGEARRAAVSSFGFGGTNFHVVLEEYQGSGKKAPALWTRDSDLILVSAANAAELKKRCEELAAKCEKGKASLTVLAYGSQKAFDAKAEQRLAIVGASKEELAGKLRRAGEAAAAGSAQAPGVFYAQGKPNAGKIAFLFPGQGSQYPWMGADVAMAFGKARAIWDRASWLESTVFPKPAYVKNEEEAQAKRLARTEWAQPAIGAASAALLAVLSMTGLQPDAVAGHSFGELPALFAAGVMDEEELLAAARRRGELMAASTAHEAGMLSVAAGVGEVETLLADWGLDLVIANHNAPKQTVLSGVLSALAEAERLLTEKGLRCTKLPVSTAFHSPLMQPAADEFAAFLRPAKFGEPGVTIYSNLDADVAKGSGAEIALRLADQIAAPVRFQEMIERMHADGVRTFVEVGPRDVLSNMVKSILEGQEHQAIALDRAGTHGVHVLWQGLGRLSVAGVALDYGALRAEYGIAAEEPAPKVQRFTIPVDGGNVGRPYPPPEGAAGMPKPIPPAPAGSKAAETKAVESKSLKAAEPVAAAPAVPVAPAGGTATKIEAAVKAAGKVERAAPASRIATRNPERPRMSEETPMNERLRAYEIFQESIRSAQQQWQDNLSRGHESYLAAMEAAYWSALGEATPGGVRAEAPAARPVMQAPVAAAPVAAAPLAAVPVMQAPVAVPQVAAAVPVAAAPVVAVPVAAPVAAAPTQDVAAVLAAIIADKTGYPVEMLEPSMALEADLGIDSIKRVEIFSALTEQIPGLPEIDPAKMGTVKTLGEIAEMLDGMAPQGPPAAKIAAAPVAAAGVDLTALLRQIVADKTGYPAEMLEPGMALEADLGIDSIKRVEIFSALQEQVPGMPEMDPAKMGTVRTLGDITEMLGGVMPAAAPVAAVAATAGAGVDLAALLRQIVSDKTGYPAEMLEPGMALEADLGIDSIKRVEIFSALQEQVPGMPEMDPAKMGTVRTLGDITEMLGGVMPAAAPVAAVVSAPAVAAVAAVANDTLAAVLRQIVAEKTGYPAEMLEPSMALEADLGIDSIKRVEIFSALQEQVAGLPEMDPARMGSLRTLGDIVEALQVEAGGGAASATAGAASQVEPVLLEIIAEKTGYPVDILQPAMALEADLGIDSIKRVEIFSAVSERLPGMPEMDPAKMGALMTIGDVIAALGTTSAVPVKAAPVAAVEAESIDLPDPGVPMPNRLVACVRPVAASGHATLRAKEGAVVIRGEGEGLRTAVVAELRQRGFTITDNDAEASAWISLEPMAKVSTIAEAIAVNRRVLEMTKGAAGRLSTTGGALVLVQDTGGDFASPAELAAWSAGAPGLARTAAIEWPQARVKVVDLERGGRSVEAQAQALVNELVAGGPEVDTGLRADGTRLTTDAVMSPATGKAEELPARPVVLATGGARGVTAASLIAMAERWKTRGGMRIALLGRTALADEPEYLHGCADEAAIKKAILSRGGRKPAPAKVQAQVQQVLGAREVRATIQAMEAAGSEVRYLAVDVRDTAQLNSAIEGLRKAWGPIHGLVHGAGVLADKRLTDLTLEQFDAVFSTKVSALEALLAVTASDPLHFLILFSSVASRYGNAGQAAYAMANEVLNKVACAEARRRGRAAVVKSICWGPWNGGMVTPALSRHFEKMGVALMPVEAGALAFVEELISGVDAVEIVRGAPLPEAPREMQVRVSHASFPHLEDHRIKNVPVLPVVEALHLFLQAATAADPGAARGARIEIKVLNGVKLNDFESSGELLVVRRQGERMELVSGSGVKHYEARITQDAGNGNGQARQLDAPLENAPWTQLYDAGLLFHGPQFRVVEHVDGINDQGIAGKLTPRNGEGWRHGHAGYDGGMLDGGLQFAQLWGWYTLKRMTLPMRIGAVRLVRPPESDAPIECRVAAVRRSSGLVCDIEFRSPEHGLLATMTDVEMYVVPNA